MTLKHPNFKITNREQDIMEALWQSNKPLLASDITKENTSLSISSVQLALRNLLSKNLIEVAEIVYSGTVLSRSYRPLISKEDFLINSFRNIDDAVTTRNIVATLLKHEKNEPAVIKELEQLLEERKQQLQQESNDKKGE